MPSVFLFYPLRAVEANEGASPPLSLSLFFSSEEEKSLLSSLSPVSFPADAGEEGERELVEEKGLRSQAIISRRQKRSEIQKKRRQRARSVIRRPIFLPDRTKGRFGRKGSRKVRRKEKRQERRVTRLKSTTAGRREKEEGGSEGRREKRPVFCPPPPPIFPEATTPPWSS